MARPALRRRSAPMLTHPCPACHRPTRTDGHCRTRGCPNRFPDPAEARAEALALARRLAQRPTTLTTDDQAPTATTEDR